MWLTTNDLALLGFNGYPSISLQTQNNLRRSGKIKYIKLGRSVYYKHEWIEEYINSNIRPVKTEKDAHAS
jgi:hypothetical protein